MHTLEVVATAVYVACSHDKCAALRAHRQYPVAHFCVDVYLEVAALADVRFLNALNFLEPYRGRLVRHLLILANLIPFHEASQIKMPTAVARSARWVLLRFERNLLQNALVHGHAMPAFTHLPTQLPRYYSRELYFGVCLRAF